MADQKRIRLTVDECDLIHRALRNVDQLPRTKEALQKWDAERLKRFIINNFELIPTELTKKTNLSTLSRRFSVLAADEGWAARGSRRSTT